MNSRTLDQVESPRDLDKKEADYGLKSPQTIDSSILEKGYSAPVYGSDSDLSEHFNQPPQTARDLATEVIHAKDDPTLSPWTFRTWFIGMGLSIFGGVLGTIYYFKPQTLGISTVFLGVVSYVLGELLSHIIPRKTWLGRLLNPHPFNSKEHAAIMIMSSTAASAPLAVEVLAVNKLYYNKATPAIVGIILTFSSQCLGYGLAGIMRKTLTYPTNMLYPSILPTVSLVEVLHGEKSQVKKKLRVFYIGFTVLFFWEFFPQYIMPVLTGISIFCLSNRKNMLFTRLFGGSNGNEGLGLFSICFDWQYIGGAAMWLPLQTLWNNFIGYILCIVVFMAIYQGNIWQSQQFPFLSQLLFTNESTSAKYVQFNQSEILGANQEVDMNLVDQKGLPYFAGTFMAYILTTNLAITATLTHMMLWNYDDIKSAWAFAAPSQLKKLLKPSAWKFWQNVADTRDPNSTDPHLKLMLRYKDAPNWWYLIVFALSILLGLISIYQADSTLPWWGFLVATAISSICILFFGAQYALTGFAFNVQPVIQMLGGYLHPGKPVANMYFVLFGYNSVSQGQLLIKDLKFAQYTHLSPRCTFTMQMVGTIVGSIFSYIIMDSITTNQREILLSIEGTNIWSGQTVQTYNSQAIAWGGLASRMFSVGGRYQWVTLAFLIGFIAPVPLYIAHKFYPKLRLNYWNTSIISYYMGFLCVGINSSLTAFFAVGFFCQFWLRKYRSNWFIKYNYLLSAAMDGGTQVLVFILTFAVFGGAGKAVDFPKYWGNNQQSGNFDYCMKDLGSKGQ
ncbi:OPT superfamily oligopeptide transporter [Microthyrium microscopicum]|uniref:OPT superfamily oligopeptide transporter n=1 Tax=Microthyrium microscopicum TaxID=703497 RepID=A0A6A6UNK3_9PEZI|nr:OPT superfamily oligopeptide transporter [Microthyrium microscopicum]